MNKKARKGVSLMLSAGLLLTGLAGCGAQETETKPAQNDAAQEAQEEEAALSGENITGGKKTETVYANADAFGTVQEVNVTTKLQVPGAGLLEDKSNLTDIKNQEGDERFERKDGVIRWESLGEDIEYEGTSDQPLPVNVTVSYYLDGKEITPEELAGKSGQVTIRFDYENTALETVEADGEELSVKVPFLAMTAIQLDGDHFTDIEVTNGKVLEAGDTTLAVGYAMPGLADSLCLSDYELSEDVEIPEYVEVTAKAREFELDFTATVVTSGLFSDLDEEDLQDAEDLTDSMEELSEASGELADGSAELLEGSVTFGGYLGEYLTGISSMQSGTAALDTGLQTLNENKALLNQGAAALEEGLKQLNDSLAQVSLSSADAQDTSLTEAFTAFSTDAAALGEALAGIQTALSALETYGTEVSTYAATVSQCAQAVQTALDAIAIADGTQTARDQAAAALSEALTDTELTQEQKDAISSKVQEGIDLSQVNDAAKEQVSAAKEALAQLTALSMPTAPDLSTLDLTALTETIGDMQTQLTAISQGMSSLKDTLSGLSGAGEMLETMKAGVAQLYAGSQSLTQGTGSLGEGISQLAQGSSQLSEGCTSLVSAGTSLNSGYGELTEGLSALSEGLETFDEEGIQELSSLAGDDLTGLLRRVKALKKADQGFCTFAGLSDGMEGAVRFIIETEGVSAD